MMPLFNISWVMMIPLLLFLCGCQSAKKPHEYKSKRAQQRKEKKIERLAAGRKTKLKEMGHEELKERYETLLALNDIKNALKYLEQLLPLIEDHGLKQQLLVKAAELYFEDGSYQKASAKYLQYVLLYPGGEHAELASYKAILCYFYQTLSSECDQTITAQALDLAKEFLNTQSFVHYKDEVTRIVDNCYQKLFEHEKNIIEQKIDWGTPESINAARMRLAYLKDVLGQDYVALEPQIASLEQQYLSLLAPIDHEIPPSTMQATATQLAHDDQPSREKPLYRNLF